MKIDMNLFCLIVALATSITDGRLLSSSSLSSSSSQPGGGSAVEVTPTRRDLEPVIVDSKPQLEPLEYCTAIDRKDGDGKQRGVVDWQNFDQCNKCEGGQLWWPCDSNLCIGFCTPEAVCEERLRLATAIATAPDDTTSMLLIESLRKQLRDSKDKQDYYRSQISDVAVEKNIEIERLEVEAEKAADDCTAELEEMVRLQEGLDANTRRLLDLYVSKNTALEKQIAVLKAAAAPDCSAELEEAVKSLSQKEDLLINSELNFYDLRTDLDAAIYALETEIAILKYSPANIDDPTTIAILKFSPANTDALAVYDPSTDFCFKDKAYDDKYCWYYADRFPYPAGQWEGESGRGDGDCGKLCTEFVDGDAPSTAPSNGDC